MLFVVVWLVEFLCFWCWWFALDVGLVCSELCGLLFCEFVGGCAGCTDFVVFMICLWGTSIWLCLRLLL